VIVLGIDPGTAVTGYGVVSRADDGAVSLVECGVIRTTARRRSPTGCATSTTACRS
jgi:crossover junction endodeoxyribonuclease RuvC